MFLFSAATVSRTGAPRPGGAHRLPPARWSALSARDGLVLLDEEAFRACPAISIDYAVMEKTARAAVVPLEAGWSDVRLGCPVGPGRPRRRRERGGGDVSP